MADSDDVPEKGMNAWGQAISAVALAAALAIGIWVIAKTDAAGSSAEPKPATCSGGEAEKGAKAGEAAGQVTGAQLCGVLNRRDLADLLGTPTEIAKSASGSGSSVKTAGGREISTPSARVEFETYTVTLEGTYDGHPVADTAGLFGDPQERRTFLGRRAVLYSDRTINIRFRLDGSDSSSAPGVPARVLSVAQDEKDRGGSFELTLWRSDGAVPDDTVLFQVAETVLPSIPGWGPAE
ncbi:DUF6215 domain-containing protein [Streptomyces sp. AcE210]|uniref:DUF6215 domain-containing protein n=1 Tax=Streptomyces sp. AcE210 TaxID=2292703 RepID=UPI000E3040CE|nr:DUF6215 domain-containing protein [Streptomyces sp. AcE210]RFC73666.1 hypothetical protein DXZ75_43810 [Streptomyces sp. AcE210]